MILFLLYAVTRLRSLGNMLHECSHYTLFSRKPWNRMAGHFLAMILFESFDTYRKEHLTHHLYLGDAKKDRDFSGRFSLSIHKPLTREAIQIYFRHLFSLKFYHIYLRPVFFSKNETILLTSIRFIWIAIIFYSGIILGKNAVIFSFLIPFISTYQWIRYFSDLVDHAGIISNNNEFLRTRNHICSSTIISHFLFPRKDMFHLTHHLFPLVPTWKLSEMHSILLEDGEYSSRSHEFHFSMKGLKKC
jgi:fatty acid desaturase